MKTVTVFLGSSTELAPEVVSLADFSGELNSVYQARRVRLRLEQWRWPGDDPAVWDAKRAGHTALIRSSDLCFFLFFTSLAARTAYEFATAVDSSRASAKGRPQVATWFKQLDEGRRMDGELVRLRDRLESEMGHYWNTWASVEALKLGVLMQLKRSGADTPVTVKDDRALVDGRPLVDLTQVPSYAQFQGLDRLRAELDQVQERWSELNHQSWASPADRTLAEEFSRADQRRRELEEALDKARFEFLAVTASMFEATRPGSILSPRRARAYRLFELGNVDQALALLDEDVLRAEATSAQARLDATKQMISLIADQAGAERQRLRTTADTWLQRYDMWKTKPLSRDSLAGMETALREAVAIEERAGLEPEATFQLAGFLRQQRRWDEAEAVYQDYLASPSVAGDDGKRAGGLNELGILCRKRGDLDQAAAAYDEALVIYRRLAAVNPQKYQPGLARILNSIGPLRRHQRLFDQAEAAYAEALTIYRSLAEANPHEHQFGLAKTLNNLGILRRHQGQPDQAVAAYTEALELYRILVATNPREYQPNLARALNNFGGLCRKSQRFPQADAAYTEALAIYRPLAEADPQAYQPCLAQVLNNLGILRRNQGEPDKAAAAYAEALGIYRPLAIAHPQTYRPNLARALHNVGYFLHTQGNLKEAGAALTEAVNIRRELAEADPRAHQRGFASTLNKLQRVYEDQGKHREAQAAAQEAAQIGSSPTSHSAESKALA
ncbi:MAG: tetratricopeptide repeat protein [Bifidobacteriaceae bacterium]|nr:tetratricopeptide repeat protein [Bifidobacteriaceae bacterium]